ncbi:MAG: tyrosine-type recombinase/integrase [Planctomycetota bacterium]
MGRKRRARKRAGKTNRGRRFPPEVLTASEVRHLMDACSRKSTTGVRNRALIATLYRAGLRIAEALSLLPKDVDLDAGTIRVLHGKGDRSRTVGIDAGATDLIRTWLEVREGLRPGVGAPLFCTRSGAPMNTSYVRQFLPRLARRAGIEKRVHPHGFRHTHAAELAAENVPINVIQAQLGHSNAATTSRYIEHIAPQQLISTIRQRTWRAS